MAVAYSKGGKSILLLMSRLGKQGLATFEKEDVECDMWQGGGVSWECGESRRLYWFGAEVVSEEA